MQPFFEYSHEVLQAIKSHQPILALESTIITHGLPKTTNCELAIELENIARAEQVTPATIAIMHGKIKIGLSKDEIIELSNQPSAFKASRRDIAYALQQKLFAGTTVAATLFCAANANIKVFATGGIGGVHRGDAQDISADLIELSRSPLAVVCAGAKAILDLPKTLEFLETFSIPVIGYQTTVFPAFYSAQSEYTLSTSVNSISALVDILKTHWELGNSSGVLIANPVPALHEISRDEIEPYIQTALQKAQLLQIGGKHITPFLLNELVTYTQGKSVKTNIELIKNNVTIASILARQLFEGAHFSVRHNALYE